MLIGAAPSGPRLQGASPGLAPPPGPADGPFLLAQSPQQTPDRAKQAGALLDEAEDLADAGRFEAALQKVQDARSIDPDNKRIPKVEKDIKETRVDRLLDQAKAAIKNKNFDEAAKALDQAAQFDAKNSKVADYREWLAEERADEASRKLEGQLDTLLDQAEELLDQEKFAEADQAVDQALKLQPEDKRAHKLKDKIAEERQEFEADRVKDQVKQYLKQADEALDQRNFPQAEQAVDQALKLQADNSKALKLKTVIAREKAEFQDKSTQQQVDDYLDKADEAADARNYDQALALLDEAQKLQPDNAHIQKVKEDLTEDKAKWEQRQARNEVKELLNQAEDLLDEDQFSAAREKVQKVLDKDPKNDSALELRAEIDDAEREAKARQVEDQVDALVDQAHTQLKADQFEAARQTVNRALELNKDHKKANDLLARINEDEAEAKQSANEQYIDSQMEKAEDLRDRGQFDDAIAIYDELLAQYGDNEDVRDERTAALEEKQDALADQKRAQMKADAKAADQLADQGKDALDQKQYDRAIELFQQALEKDPSNKTAQQYVVRARDEKQKASAQQMTTTAVAAAPAKSTTAQPEQTATEAVAAKTANEEAAAKKAAEEAAAKKAAEEAAAKKAAEAAVATKTAEEEAQAAQQKKQMEQTRNEWMKKGDSALSDKSYDDAIQAYTKALEADPSFTAAQAKIEQATAEKAQVQGRQASQQEFNRLIDEAKQLLETRNFTDARVRAREALALNVDNGEAQDLLDDIDRAEKRFQADQAEAKVREARQLLEQNQFDAANAAFQQALQIQPDYEPAKEGLDDVAEARQAYQRRQSRGQRAQTEREARALLNEGITLYNQKKLEEARGKWLEAKDLVNAYNAEFPESPLQIPDLDTYLRNTEEEYNRLLAERARRSAFSQREEEAQDKMNTPVTIKTERTTPLVSFLNTLRLATGIDFVVAEVSEAKVDASFQDKPLHEVLDAVLLPLGLKWERDPGSDVVKITPDLRTVIFTLTPDEASNVNALLENKTLQKLLYGGDGSPRVQGQEIYLDERQLVLVVTDSQMNIDKVSSLLETLKSQAPPGLIWRSYTIKEEKGPEIKAMLDALLRIDAPEPYQPERKLLLEGTLLILKDTPENIKKAEEILQDQDFLEKIYSKTLAVETFNLTPVTALEANPDLVTEFADFVVEVVETMLYAKEGRQKARSEGRRLWFDPATMQLTITDYPENLAAVSEFIDSLPQIRKKKRTKIIFLKHGLASEMKTQIDDFLGIGEQVGPTTAGGTEITRTLRTGGGTGNEFTWRDITLRVTRVNDNNVNDDSDNSAEILIRTPGQSQTITLENYRSEFVDDYEIIAEDIKPSTTPGEGRAKLKIIYRPTGGGGGGFGPGGFGPSGGPGAGPGLGAPAPGVEPTPAPTEEEPGVNIVEIENLNALFVEYRNANDLKEISYWIETLDVPTLQVSLEVKFVEVVEDRANELSSQITIDDLTNIDFSNNSLFGAFGRDIDEFRSGFEPGIETARGANLPKGTSFLNWQSGTDSQIDVKLRYLEASGVINIVNGPHVTVLNRETADFEIQRQFGIPLPLEGATSGGGGNDQLTIVPSLNAVQITLEPTITSLGNITLDIDGEINDFDQNLASVSVLQPSTGGDLVSGQPGTNLAAITTDYQLGVLRKVLTTKVRIKDGGTVVLGGWTSLRDQDLESGVPLLGDLPFVGKLLFSRSLKTSNKITLLIFLTGNIVD